MTPSLFLAGILAVALIVAVQALFLNVEERDRERHRSQEEAASPPAPTVGWRDFLKPSLTAVGGIGVIVLLLLATSTSPPTTGPELPAVTGLTEAEVLALYRLAGREVVSNEIAVHEDKYEGHPPISPCLTLDSVSEEIAWREVQLETGHGLAPAEQQHVSMTLIGSVDTGHGDCQGQLPAVNLEFGRHHPDSTPSVFVRDLTGGVELHQTSSDSVGWSFLPREMLSDGWAVSLLQVRPTDSFRFEGGRFALEVRYQTSPRTLERPLEVIYVVPRDFGQERIPAYSATITWPHAVTHWRRYITATAPDPEVLFPATEPPDELKVWTGSDGRSIHLKSVAPLERPIEIYYEVVRGAGPRATAILAYLRAQLGDHIPH